VPRIPDQPRRARAAGRTAAGTTVTARSKRKMNADVPPSGSTAGARAPSPSSLVRLRAGLFGLGLILGVGGVWLLVPDLLKAKTIELAQDRASAVAQSGHETGAFLAAAVGALRGDLWAQAAFADSAVLWQARAGTWDTATADRVGRARSRMEKALALGPINGEGWLFLALLPAANADNRVATWLQMSYFTAPHALDIAPLRIERAATSNAFADKTIQDLVKSDIRLVLTYRPQLKPAILAALRNAWPQNRPILEGLIADIDPGLVQSTSPHQAK
jgi:hypothetical protein